MRREKCNILESYDFEELNEKINQLRKLYKNNLSIRVSSQLLTLETTDEQKIYTTIIVYYPDNEDQDAA